jgi:hypothetical protein
MGLATEMAVAEEMAEAPGGAGMTKTEAAGAAGAAKAPGMAEAGDAGGSVDAT